MLKLLGFRSLFFFSVLIHKVFFLLRGAHTMAQLWVWSCPPKDQKGPNQALDGHRPDDPNLAWGSFKPKTTDQLLGIAGAMT